MRFVIFDLVIVLLALDNQVFTNGGVMESSLLLENQDGLAIITLVFVAPSNKFFEEFVEGSNSLAIKRGLKDLGEDFWRVSHLLSASSLSLLLTFDSLPDSDFNDDKTLNDSDRFHSPFSNDFSVVTFVANVQGLNIFEELGYIPLP